MMVKFMIWLHRVKWACYELSFDDVVDAYARMDDETKDWLIKEYNRFNGEKAC